MKKLVLFALLAGICFPVFAQLDSTGGTHVNFTVDADTRTGYSKLGPPTDSVIHNDDWFSLAPYGGTGKSVIDTTGASYYKSLLQANRNISFTKRMSLPPYAVWGMKFWVDGLYNRDFAGSDSTAFTVACKNGDNPAVWQGGHSSVQSKSDIIDSYMHVRTSGVSPTTDSVWFFAGVATAGVTGSRYFDIEVYREEIGFDRSTGKFTSAGTTGGHSEWRFDASGKVIQTGDIIISVSYDNRSAPQIDFRIWVSNTTFSTVTPTAFRFSGSFDGNGGYGYAQILSPSGTSRWGAGMGNYSNSAGTDSTYATPWGTVNTSGAWSQNYDRLQFVEISLNFSRFGMNPFSYVTSFCKSPYSSILVKSRASPSFSANLVDFTVPDVFSVKNLAPFTITSDTITCAQPTANVQLNVTARNYYRWKKMDGTVVRADSDNPLFPVTVPDRYVVESTNFQGCAAMQRDTVLVPADTIRPVAKAFLGWGQSHNFLRGGDTSASRAPTPYGGSTGLSWSWIGPNSFTSTDLNARLNDPVDEGMYTFRIGEGRNGCQSSASIYVTMQVLEAQNVQLVTKKSGAGLLLTGSLSDPAEVQQVEFQKSVNGILFKTLGGTSLAPGQKQCSFLDTTASGETYYRLRVLTKSGKAFFSNLVQEKGTGGKAAAEVWSGTGATLHIKGARFTQPKMTVRVLDLDGRLLEEQAFKLTGTFFERSITLPTVRRTQPVVVMVWDGAQAVTTKKLLLH